LRNARRSFENFEKRKKKKLKKKKRVVQSKIEKKRFEDGFEES
jgi:hypothetical protein